MRLHTQNKANHWNTPLPNTWRIFCLDLPSIYLNSKYPELASINPVRRGRRVAAKEDARTPKSDTQGARTFVRPRESYIYIYIYSRVVFLFARERALRAKVKYANARVGDSAIAMRAISVLVICTLDAKRDHHAREPAMWSGCWIQHE